MTPDEEERRKAAIMAEFMAGLAPLGQQGAPMSAPPPPRTDPRSDAIVSEARGALAPLADVDIAQPDFAAEPEHTPDELQILREFQEGLAPLGQVNMAMPVFPPAGPPPKKADTLAFTRRYMGQTLGDAPVTQAAKPQVAISTAQQIADEAKAGVRGLSDVQIAQPSFAAPDPQSATEHDRYMNALPDTPPRPLEPRPLEPGPPTDPQSTIEHDRYVNSLLPPPDPATQLADQERAYREMYPDAAPGPAEAPAPQAAAPAPVGQETPKPKLASQRYADTLGSFQNFGQAQRPLYELPPPPMRKVDTTSQIFAALIDLAVNKGRNQANILKPLLDDVDYENWKRQADYAQMVNANRGRYQNPLEQQLAVARFMQGQDRLAANVAKTESEAARKEAELNPDSQISKDYVAALSENFPGRAHLFRGKSKDALIKAGYVTESAALNREKTRSEAVQLANAESDRRARRDYAYAMNTLAKQDEYAQRRDYRATERDIDDRKRAAQVVFTSADTDMARLEDTIAAAVAKKGADYRIPTQGGFLEQFFVTGDQAVFGGTGMDFDDTELVSMIKGSALPDWIRVAGNAPNTATEQQAAFMKWFSTGKLGDMLRFVRSERAQGQRKLENLWRVYGSDVSAAPLAPEPTAGQERAPVTPRRPAARAPGPQGAPPQASPQQAAPQIPKGKIGLVDPKTGRLLGIRDDTTQNRTLAGQRELKVIEAQ